MENLDNRIQNIQNRLQILIGRKEGLQSEINLLDRDIQEQTLSISNHEKATEVFSLLLDKMNEESKTKIERMANYGLKTVFFDQDLSFFIDVSTRGKYPVAHLRARDNVKEFDGSILKSFGGGVAFVLSFLLRVITILKTNKPKVLIDDESFLGVSEKYCPGVSELISLVCEDLGFDILLITHNPWIPEKAKHSYKVETDDGVLKFNRI